MKKVLTILAVLALAAPVMADVTITASDGTGGNLQLAYAPDAGDELVGLALVLDCGTGGDMIDVSAGSYTIDSFFDVFIDAYYTDPVKLDDITFSDDTTTPFADSDGPGQVTASAAKVSLCIAALKNPPAGGPAVNPLALIKVIDGDADGQVTVTVTVDGLRGGGVDLAGAVTVNIAGSPATVVTTTECYVGQPDYAQWVAVGKPDCWCYARQCHGDADGKANKIGQWVDTTDLNILKAGWLKTAAQLTGVDACADFDRKANKIGQRVDTTDLNILKLNWLGTAALIPADCPATTYVTP